MKRLAILLIIAAAGAVAACTPSNTGASPTLPVESTAPSVAAPSESSPAMSPSESGGLPSESSSAAPSSS